MLKRKKHARGDANVAWIEQYCIVPSGPNKGEHVKLAPSERALLLYIYDAANGPRSDVLIEDRTLAAYVTLLHLVGFEARQQTFRPATVGVDSFTVWACCSEHLCEYLERKGEHIVCPALGTRYPAVAA